MTAFGIAYADAYDRLYTEKDYDSECAMIEALLGAGSRSDKRLLDLGCGTGNHAIPLAKRGYSVIGVDLSEAMLRHARQKAAAAGVSARTTFLQGDVRTVQLVERDFGAAIMMFAVLGYQRSDSDVRSTLATVRAHLACGASLVFDVWYGPGVLVDRPKARERIVEHGSERIVRRTSIVLAEEQHLCSVQFDLTVCQDGRQTASANEVHIMRFFFPEELKRFSEECGFELVTLRDFRAWEQPVHPASWNAVGLLRAV